MKRIKTKYSAKQKARAALAALRGESYSQISSLHQVHPNQIGKWKKILEKESDQLFSGKKDKEDEEKDKLIEELYKTIGKREMELSWLKKKLHLEP